MECGNSSHGEVADEVAALSAAELYTLVSRIQGEVRDRDAALRRVQKDLDTLRGNIRAQEQHAAEEEQRCAVARHAHTAALSTLRAHELRHAAVSRLLTDATVHTHALQQQLLDADAALPPLSTCMHTAQRRVRMHDVVAHVTTALPRLTSMLQRVRDVLHSSVVAAECGLQQQQQQQVQRGCVTRCARDKEMNKDDDGRKRVRFADTCAATARVFAVAAATAAATAADVCAPRHRRTTWSCRRDGDGAAHTCGTTTTTTAVMDETNDEGTMAAAATNSVDEDGSAAAAALTTTACSTAHTSDVDDGDNDNMATAAAVATQHSYTTSARQAYDAEASLTASLSRLLSSRHRRRRCRRGSARDRSPPDGTLDVGGPRKTVWRLSSSSSSSSHTRGGGE